MAKPPASPLRRTVNVGLVAGGVGIYLAATGIVERFEARNVVSGLPALNTLGLGDVFMLMVALGAGFIAARARPGDPASAGARVQRGVLAGAIAGGMLALFLVVVEALIAAGMNVREILVNISPGLRTQLTLGQTVVVGALLLIVGGGVLGGLAGATHLLRPRIRKPLLIGLLATLLVSLSEPLVNPMLRGLEIGRAWLYQRGGLSFTGFLLVFILAVVASYGSEQLKAAGPAEPPPQEPGDEAVGTAEMANRDLVAFGLGAAALVMSVVLVVMAFAEIDLDATITLVAFLLSVAAVLVGAVVLRLSGARTGRALQGFVMGGAALAILLPQIVGGFVSDVLGTVGLYVLLGLGLNIVVGYAGLLDLGYVAFFAVGAYAMAILTSPAAFLVTEEGQAFSPDRIGWTNFWFALPIVIVIAVIVGVMIGAPVLGLRGDYLAIVTLGFGEIVRTLVISDWLEPWLGGAQG
ncbi:MAG: hypothetical protein M3245_03200, partial [Actinomycetota bacterium]|nr:hypothetical protein [Actinomycetota bacterium]